MEVIVNFQWQTTKAQQPGDREELSEAKDVKMLLILLNARVRSRPEAEGSDEHSDQTPAGVHGYPERRGLCFKLRFSCEFHWIKGWWSVKDFGWNLTKRPGTYDLISCTTKKKSSNWWQPQGLLYKSINTPWILVRREDGKELWRGDDEPTKEAPLLGSSMSSLRTLALQMTGDSFHLYARTQDALLLLKPAEGAAKNLRPVLEVEMFTQPSSSRERLLVLNGVLFSLRQDASCEGAAHLTAWKLDTGVKFDRMLSTEAASNLTFCAPMQLSTSMWPVWFSDARLALWLLLASSLAFRIVPLSLILLQLVVCVAAVSCSVTFYIHTTRTVFNRRPPWALLPFWRHFMMTRPLEVLWRFLTVPFRVYPDFLILGEVRTGTTSAAAYLRTLGCLGPFSPWIHPLATDKESFYFVGHYWGLVHPGAYRMCFPLKISIWWHEFWHGERPLVFDACASHLSAPWAPALLWQACPKAALLVIVRQPELQHKSWWRLETNAIAWGRAMGMGEDFLKEGYPPKTLPEAVAWSQSEEVQQLYQKGEQEVHQAL
eukprot:symbB.v1.2.002822.t2/scaffold152.1/size294938/9